MKKITALSILSTLVMALGIMTFNSCTKDACKDVTCVNGTTTTVGSTCSCTCSAGAFGSGCSSTYSGVFLTSSGASATWKITGETSGTPPTAVNYSNPNMTATAVDFTTLALDNFYGAGTGTAKNLTVRDSVGTLSSGSDTLTFTAGGNTYKIYNYSGALNAGKTVVNYSYQIQVGGTTETATGTLVKQ